MLGTHKDIFPLTKLPQILSMIALYIGVTIRHRVQVMFLECVLKGNQSTINMISPKVGVIMQSAMVHVNKKLLGFLSES